MAWGGGVSPPFEGDAAGDWWARGAPEPATNRGRREAGRPREGRSRGAAGRRAGGGARARAVAVVTAPRLQLISKH